jgi:SAM-dependent methyltransferase
VANQKKTDDFSRPSREYFDSEYGRVDSYWGDQPNLLVPMVSGHLKPGSRVLEVGCGEGRNAIFLARLGFDVVATDIAEKGIEKARRLAEINECKPEFINLDAHESHDHLGSFDCVLLLNVLQLLHSERIPRAMRHFQSIVTPGGIMAVEVFTVEDPLYKRLVESRTPTIAPLTINHPSRGYPVRFFEKGEIASYFGSWELIYYNEGLIYDRPHGVHADFHEHGLAQLVARKKLHE